MRPLLSAIVFISATLYSFSCKHVNTGTLEYSKLKYDTNRITIFKWDTTKYLFPNNSDPLPLTQEDLFIVDSLLRDAIDSFNNHISPSLYQAFDRIFAIDSFIIKQERYRYQYFPIKNVNGQRVMTIIGFSVDFQPWKTEVYKPSDHYGMRMLELNVNLLEKTRDNLRSGDFG
jgi:hypothetical protein